MDEFTVKTLLKKMKQHETTMSAVMGVIAILLAVYAISPYFQKLKTEPSLMIQVTPSPLPLIENLPDQANLDILPVLYVVKKGDSSWKIAQAFYGSSDYVTDIEQENNLQSDQQLNEGTTLTIPRIIIPPSEKKASSAATEVVQPITRTYKTLSTDTLWRLAQKFYGDGNKWTKIYDANKSVIKDPNSLEKDVVLTIPQ